MYGPWFPPWLGYGGYGSPWSWPPGEPKRNEVTLAVDAKNAGIDAMAAALYGMHAQRQAGVGAGNVSNTYFDMSRFWLDMLRRASECYYGLYAGPGPAHGVTPGATYTHQPAQSGVPTARLLVTMRAEQKSTLYFDVPVPASDPTELMAWVVGFDQNELSVSARQEGPPKIAATGMRRFTVDVEAKRAAVGKVYNGLILIALSADRPVYLGRLEVTVS